MNIPLMDLDGKIISTLKTYVMECYSCWNIDKDKNIVFCKKCGKNTVLKVTCEDKEDGELVLYRKKNKKIKKRGNRYPIP